MEAKPSTKIKIVLAIKKVVAINTTTFLMA